MAVRTTTWAVQAILLNDFGETYTGGFPDLDPFILTASVIVDRVRTCAVSKSVTLTAVELELIERWLAAHCYALSDQPYASKSESGGGGAFQGQTGMALDATKYGQQAQVLDYSGCLRAIGRRQTASAAWVGKVPSEQIDVRDRS